MVDKQAIKRYVLFKKSKKKGYGFLNLPRDAAWNFFMLMKGAGYYCQIEFDMFGNNFVTWSIHGGTPVINDTNTRSNFNQMEV